ALEYILDQTEEAKQKQAADEKIENLNTIPTPIMSIDTDFNITFMNPAGAAVAGSTPDEVVGKKCYDLFKTPHCKTDKCACARAMKTDSVITEQTIARPAEGVIIPIKYTGAPIKDAKGNIKGALEYILDQTEEAKQKQAADEKIENLNTIPTPILSVDTDFNITFMNPAGAGLLGSTPDEVIGKKCYDLFKTPHCKTDKCACARAMKTDSVVTEQTVARPSEGVNMPIQYTGAPIKDAKGNIKGALEYVVDVTAEKEVERLIAGAVSEVDSLVSASKKQMDKANTQVDDMNDAIDKAVQQLDDSVLTISTMQESSKDMLELSAKSNDLASELAKEAETGKVAGRDAGQKLADINDTMMKNNEMVNGLVSQLEKISSFVDIIKEIASQTNLLAFNAAIEAARAGDAGRGFAVVADEVRKLAENSSKSAIDISNIVKNVEKESHQTISAMQDGMNMLGEGGRVINTALESMETISKGITTISDSVDKVSGVAEELSSNGSEVMDKIQLVASSSKDNQKSTVMVNESLTETVAALTQLASSSQELQEAVNKL
ncbi:MAG: methyl-accepting chemotaxis protein, partial [Desulfobulbaceae bacterium]